MNRPAHTIKAGDKINGITVFDSIRKTFGGFYIPMSDGSRVTVKTIDQLVRISG